MPRSSRALAALALSAAAAALLVACGGGSDGAGETTVSAAGRPLDARARAATTSLAVAIPRTADPLLQNLAIPADAPTRGMWSATQAWPMNGLHAALMPDGKVLTYGTPANAGGTQDGRTYDLWDPSRGFGAGSHVTTFDANRVNSFCSTAAWRADGVLMITGGNGPQNTALFNPGAGSSVTDPFALADQRWYATMLTLPDGRLVMLGGMDPYSEGMQNAPDAAIANGSVSMTPELYTPGTGWRSLTGARSRDAFGPDWLRTSYPRAWVMPDGRVGGISAERLWSLDVSGNNGTGAITIHGAYKQAPSVANPVNVGATSSAVMFAPGRVLQAGGNGGFNGDGLPASNRATVVDFTGATPVVTETGAMGNARRFVNLVVLPDGKVVATGGTRAGNNAGADAVYAAEIWNPASGTWTVGASAAQVRVYHSATLLLPNGAVLSTGGGAPGPVTNLNAEVYYPPYLFRTVNGVAQLAPRPVMTGISGTRFSWGEQLQVEMQDATAVARMTLVGNGTVTHGFNNSQRFQDVAFTQAGDRLTVTLPASANLAPPGYYQLVALDAQGVPSKAVIISVGMQAGPGGSGLLSVGTAYAFDAVSSAGNAIGTDAGQLGVLVAAPSVPPATAQFTARQGLADPACFSLESVALQGTYLRHQGYRLRLGANDGTDLMKADATFCAEPGLSGSGVTLRSKNFPTYVLRHRNGELWIDPQAADAAFAASATFTPRPYAATTSPLPTVGPIQAPPIAANGTARFSPGLEAAGLTFSWTFGDGSAATAFSAASATTHAYAAPGVYTVTLTVKNAAGQTATKTFVQAVYGAPTATAARASGALALEPRTGAATRLWVANPDTDTVGVIDTATGARVAEIAVGRSPRSVAVAPDGRIWVVNKAAASISIVNPNTLAVAATVALPRASQPHGLVFAPGGSAYVALEASGQLLRLNATSGAAAGTLAVGANPRHLSVTGDGATVLVSRFITPALPGEATATIDTRTAGAEVVVVATGSFTVARTITLRHSDRTDTEIQGSGIPNYLGAAVISPDGTSAWVPSKQDNVKRGTRRNGVNLDFQNTVRAISSKIDLATQAEVYASRVDHDNASLASAAAHDATGAYLFVALETARQVEVVDARSGARLFRIEAGLAPQAVAVSADNARLYVQNFMGRTVSVVDITPLTRTGELRSAAVATVSTIGTEKLATQVLRGKQLFYDARDPRLARDAYMSCATCHSDAGHDGRVWDLSGFGEGLRNTIALRGRAGLGHGFLHWSANFDEVQDFEGQIRALAGGTGLMPDATFTAGTRGQPLGDRKGGGSADLDALAAYLGSLGSFDASPFRNANGSLTAAATAGRTVFTNAGCGTCHTGAGFSGSGDGNLLRNVGTIKATSGNRLGGALPGIDVPTLRDVWATGPYLHDGSAPTLAAAVQAHAGNTVAGTDLTNLVAYLQQIGSEEAGPNAAAATGVGLFGSYFGTSNLSGNVLAQRLDAPNFNWGTGAPISGVGADNFSVRWTGYVEATTAGSYQFRTNSDDGVRVWVDGQRVIDNWTAHAPTLNASPAIPLAAGQRVAVAIEYQEFGGGAVLQFQWKTPGAASFAAVPANRLYAQPTVAPALAAPPTAAVACGSENQTCGLPTGVRASVWYGAGSRWAVKTNVVGGIACNNATFGDPSAGTVKACRYQAN